MGVVTLTGDHYRRLTARRVNSVVQFFRESPLRGRIYRRVSPAAEGLRRLPQRRPHPTRSAVGRSTIASVPRPPIIGIVATTGTTGPKARP
jgi:hypothetical protein